VLVVAGGVESHCLPGVVDEGWNRKLLLSLQESLKERDEVVVQLQLCRQGDEVEYRCQGEILHDLFGLPEFKGKREEIG
jgi:hypothetical protein